MKTIGYIGLGKMGRNMVERLLGGKGWGVVAYDALPANVALAAKLGAEGAVSPQAVVERLVSPRFVWIMVPHGAVDDVLTQITPYLETGDTVVDGGNSNFKDTMRRAEALGAQGVHYLDVGTSGGPGGAKEGACVMIGGEKKVFETNEELFRDIAAPDAYAYMGASGAGHFVKMVHNGIEYGMMQAIAEGFDVLRASPFDLDLVEVAHIYNNKSVIESRLTRWLEEGFRKEGTGLAEISGSVSASGEGLWTVQTASDLGVAVPVIERSLRFREESQKKPSYAGKVLSLLRNQFGGHEVQNVATKTSKSKTRSHE
ncbi:MAG: phosphogluconate dehydrogenase (NAD(+)-dependent, decarboxylating) [Minisyncoccota bacterium]